MIPDLRTRNLRPELMDDPELDRGEHQQALAGLRRLNSWSRSAAILWPALKELAATYTTQKPMRVLDLACGGGDFINTISEKAKRTGVPLEMHGCDISPVAIDYSMAQNSPGRPTFFSLDVLKERLPDDFDVLTCSLFLHHLSSADVITLLAKMAAAANRAVLISDLRRTRFGYVLAWTACRLLSRSRIVHYDGPQSVCAAFTPEEIRGFALEAGLDGAKITHRWPQRFELFWRKPA